MVLKEHSTRRSEMTITIYQKDMSSCIKLRFKDFGDARIIMQILAKNNIHFVAHGDKEK